MDHGENLPGGPVTNGVTKRPNSTPSFRKLRFDTPLGMCEILKLNRFFPNCVNFPPTLCLSAAKGLNSICWPMSLNENPPEKYFLGTLTLLTGSYSSRMRLYAPFFNAAIYC